MVDCKFFKGSLEITSTIPLNGGSLEITSTIPLNGVSLEITYTIPLSGGSLEITSIVPLRKQIFLYFRAGRNPNSEILREVELEIAPPIGFPSVNTN